MITPLAEVVAAAMDSADTAGVRRNVAPIAKHWRKTVTYVVDPNGTLVKFATPVKQ